MRLKLLTTFAAAISLIALPTLASAATVIFLTSGTTWTVPSDWNNSNNTIEAIGGGAGGGGSDPSVGGGGAGGGGAYTKSINVSLTPNAVITIQIGSGGPGGGADTNGTGGGDTVLSGSGTCSAQTLCAKGGSGGTSGVTGNGTGGSGGSSASSIGNSTKNSGGAGGDADGTSGNGGGAGGAASVAGTGGAGATASGRGGNGGAGSGSGGGAAGVGDGGLGAIDGGNGTNWDATHGSGGGGGGGGTLVGSNGANGGNYGGAGGGGATDFGGNTGVGGNGIQGLIVITYTPSLPSAPRDLNVRDNTTVTGNVTVVDNLTKGSGTFLIDHPLDPKNKLLYHSFVESPDALNVYTGTATLDARGEVRVALPSYYDALNGKTEYFVRPIDAPMPGLYIKERERENAFTVGGGQPHKEISWMVTGIRHDPYILAHPIVPEVAKGQSALVPRGEYLAPDVYPQPGLLTRFLSYLHSFF